MGFLTMLEEVLRLWNINFDVISKVTAKPKDYYVWVEGDLDSPVMAYEYKHDSPKPVRMPRRVKRSQCPISMGMRILNDDQAAHRLMLIKRTRKAQQTPAILERIKQLERKLYGLL